MSKKMVVVLFDVGSKKMACKTVYADTEDDSPDMVEDNIERILQIAVDKYNENVDDDAQVSIDLVYDYYVWDKWVIEDSFNNHLEIV